MSSTHLTTMELAQMRVTNILPTEQGDIFDIDMRQYSQTAPTVVQTFGAFHLKTFAFFVPLRTIWRSYQDWLINSADTSVNPQPVYMSLANLYGLIFGLKSYDDSTNSYVRPAKRTTVGSTWSWSDLTHDDYVTNGFSTSFAKLEYFSKVAPTNTDTYDFCFWSRVLSLGEGSDADYWGGYYCFNLTTRGRMIFNILRGLGYELPSHIDFALANGSTHVFKEKEGIFAQRYDALPLLALCRVFYDYIYPSQYVQQQGFGELFGLGSTRLINDVGVQIEKMLNLIFVAYEQDFFNSLWLRPNSVAAGTNSSIFGPQAMNDTDTIDLQSTEYATRIQQSAAGQTETMSSHALRWLESMADYVIRNNVGGTRFHEFMKSHFGWVSSESDSDRSKFLKSWQDTVSFSPVTATNSSSDVLLGERAAVGSSNGGGKLKFESKEAGFLIFTSLLVPSTAYYQGIKPWCLQQSRFDFYKPELDSVDLEPVQRMEIYNCYDKFGANEIVPQDSLDDSFGFAYRYMKKYKVSHDFLTGDFRFNSRNRNMSAYHTYRDVLYNRTNLALDAKFMHADNQYNRVYALIGSDQNSYDHIETLFLWKVDKYSNMLSVGESIPLFNKQGQKVEVDNQGTQLN